MNIYKKEQINRLVTGFINDATNPKILVKIFTKPWKIPVTLYNFSKRVIGINKNVVFKPETAGEQLMRELLTVDAIVTLTKNNCTVSKEIKMMNEVFPESPVNKEDLNQLAELLNQHGSDKVSFNYHIAYSALLKGKKNNAINTLEIGLGTNNIDVLSNMGVNGKPGASLRAFRDMYPNAQVFGADIDKRVLFSEDRIKTFFVDQTSPAILSDFKKQLGGIKFDLIIDDGLHNAQANLNTLNFALDLLADDGVFVIEDIAKTDFKYYQIVEAILKNKFSVDFIQTNNNHICVFRKK